MEVIFVEQPQSHKINHHPAQYGPMQHGAIIPHNGGKSLQRCGYGHACGQVGGQPQVSVRGLISKGNVGFGCAAILFFAFQCCFFAFCCLAAAAYLTYRNHKASRIPATELQNNCYLKQTLE
jgi:hypothetical protein